MDTAAAKQQIVERLKQANNVLVTVSNNPSVDQLSACIGMTLFLNKLNKHATAVFSGQVPSTLEFLQPDKTIEKNTDSLRDFIISLDKAKADKLRYKVEDQFVRIYITPYRTSISEKDLVFSEGDFNVEVVLALGVRDRKQLDAAITQHGRILHDATVVSVNSGADRAPEIGQINWQEPSASSLCEMLVSISEAFGTGLIDKQMATAFLTGIVAETQRFSNPKTSPKVMTMSAQLMAAGANQQLIVSKLEPPPPPPEAAKPVAPEKPPGPSSPDTLNVSHDEQEPDSPEVEVKPGEIHIDKYGNIVSPEEVKQAATSMQAQMPAANLPEGANQMPTVAPAPTAAELEETPEPIADLPEPPQAEPEPEPEAPELSPAKPELPKVAPPPPLEEAKPPEPEPEDKTESKAHELLDSAQSMPSLAPPFSADTQPGKGTSGEDAPTVDPLSDKPGANDYLFNHPTDSKSSKPDQELPKLSSDTSVYPEPAPTGTPTFPKPNVESARDAVGTAASMAPFDPANNPIKSLNAQTLNEDAAKPPLPPPVPPPLPPATTSVGAPANKSA